MAICNGSVGVGEIGGQADDPRLEDAIENLAWHLRQVVRLVYIERVPIERVSVQIGVSAGSIKRQCRQAFEILRRTVPAELLEQLPVAGTHREARHGGRRGQPEYLAQHLGITGTADEVRDQLAALIDRLPLDVASVLREFYLAGHCRLSIAANLSLSLDKVRKAICHGRKLLLQMVVTTMDSPLSTQHRMNLRYAARQLHLTGTERDAYETICQLVSELPDWQRAAAEPYYRDGKNFREISAATGDTIKRTEKTLARARQKMAYLHMRRAKRLPATLAETHIILGQHVHRLSDIVLTELPASGGIYTLGLKAGIQYPNAASRIVYIGSSSSLSQRFQRYMYQREKKTRLVAKLLVREYALIICEWHPLPGVETEWIRAVEDAALQAFKARCGCYPACNVDAVQSPWLDAAAKCVDVAAKCVDLTQPIALDDLAKKLGREMLGVLRYDHTPSYDDALTNPLTNPLTRSLGDSDMGTAIISKSDAVRKQLSIMGLDASPKAVTAALADKGVRVQGSLVSTIKSKLKAAGGFAGPDWLGDDEINAVVAANAFARRVGSLDEAKRLVDVLAEITG